MYILVTIIIISISSVQRPFITKFRSLFVFSPLFVFLIFYLTTFPLLFPACVYDITCKMCAFCLVTLQVPNKQLTDRVFVSKQKLPRSHLSRSVPLCPALLLAYSFFISGYYKAKPRGSLLDRVPAAALQSMIYRSAAILVLFSLRSRSKFV